MLAWQWQHPTAQTVLLTVCVVVTPFYLWFLLRRHSSWNQKRWKPPIVDAILLWLITGGVAYRVFPSILGVEISPALASFILPGGLVALSLLVHGFHRLLRREP